MIAAEVSMLSWNEQIEFANLPPRTLRPPVENMSELEEILERVLLPLTPPERVEACEQVITAALRGIQMHALLQPHRICFRSSTAPDKRPFKLSGDAIVRASLRALAKAGCADGAAKNTRPTHFKPKDYVYRNCEGLEGRQFAYPDHRPRG